MVLVIEKRHIVAAKRLHHPRGPVDVIRRHEQVHVIRHEDIGVHRAAGLRGGVLQREAIEGEVLVGEEGGTAVHASLGDVQRLAWLNEARWSRHGRQEMERAPRVVGGASLVMVGGFGENA